MRNLLCCSLALLCACASTRASSGPELRAKAISARIRFLSDDLLEGRFTGSRGHAIAERYFATELMAMGLEPAGEGPGLWAQVVPFRGATKDAQRTALSIDGAPLKLEDEFVLTSDLRTADVDVSAPLVFAGYAVTAPEYGYDDLAGVDLRGKIAVIFSAAPLSERADFFPPTAHALYSDSRAKIARLAAKGAVGVLTVYRPEDELRLPWARASKSARLEQMSWLHDGEPGASPAGVPLRGTIHFSVFEKLLERNGTTLRALQEKVHPLDLHAVAHGRLASTFRDLKSSNVAGVLRGSDPKLRDEYVVYTAHLDHLGIGEPVKGDDLYNGAMDNASGVAAILEIAHAFTQLPERPKRSVLFVAVTAEERGLLGSEYFERFPTVPRGSMVANFNVDMLLALWPVRDLIVLGGEHSSLGPVVEQVAREQGLAVSPDPEPKQVRFIRSDQYRFVQQGIPAVAIGSGSLDEQGGHEKLLALRKQWIATKYHAPQDEWSPDAADYESMAKIARVDFLAGLKVASSPDRPRWNPGDLFEKLAR